MGSKKDVRKARGALFPPPARKGGRWTSYMAVSWAELDTCRGCILRLHASK